MITHQKRLQTMIACLRESISIGDARQAYEWRKRIKDEVVSEDLIIPLVALLDAVSEQEEGAMSDAVQSAVQSFTQRGY